MHQTLIQLKTLAQHAKRITVLQSYFPPFCSLLRSFKLQSFVGRRQRCMADTMQEPVNLLVVVLCPGTAITEHT